jgi:hypothetical protein
MTMKRNGVKGKERASYPSAADVRSHRRRFLKLVGLGLLGGSVMGLAACTEKAGKVPIDVADGHAESEWYTDGDLQIPDEWEYRLQGLPDDIQEEVVDSGGQKVDVVVDPDVPSWYEEEDWQIMGG